MKNLRYAVLGTGFWSQFQISAWNEVGGVDLVAVYNRTLSRAKATAVRFGVPAVYDDPRKLFEAEQLDFVDIITEIDAHAPLVMLAVEHKVPVICQKPMAPDPATAEAMVKACITAGIPFYVHENWRWQAPIRALKAELEDQRIGKPFRARIDMVSGFPVFSNQPLLKTLEHFIIMDLGSHLIDTARFLFGEASSIYSQTRKIHTDIAGEDVATIFLNMLDGTMVTINMAYAENYLEHDAFPQTFIFIEGERGSIALEKDYWLRSTTASGTYSRRVPPNRYSWADPSYDIVHASIVPCNADLLNGLKGISIPETTGDDNLETMKLVFKAYESAKTGESLSVSG